MKTIGISPKAPVAGIAAVASLLVTQEILDLPLWAKLAALCVVTFLAAYSAPPGVVEDDR